MYTVPPKSFFIGSLEISFYGIIMAVSMFVGVILACKLAKKRGIKSDDILLLALIVLPFAVLGARIYYCLFHNADYTFLDFFNIKKGGLAVLGGVIGGVIGILIFALIKKNFRIIIDLLDICAPCLILGQGIGRIGCFFSQCCYGVEVTNPNLQWFPFSVLIESYEGSGVYTWHLATQLYESLWNFVGVALLLLVYFRSDTKSDTVASYLLWYGVGRTIIEGFRGDSLFLGSSSIRVSQALSIILVILGTIIIVYNFIRKKKNGQKI